MSFGGAVIVLHGQGRAGGTVPAFALIDLVLGALFAVAFAVTAADRPA